LSPPVSSTHSVDLTGFRFLFAVRQMDTKGHKYPGRVILYCTHVA